MAQWGGATTRSSDNHSELAFEPIACLMHGLSQGHDPLERGTVSISLGPLEEIRTPSACIGLEPGRRKVP